MKSKKILYLGPSFMDYEKDIIDYLSDSFMIDYVDTEKILQKARKKYQSRDLFIKGLLKLIRPVRSFYREKLLIDLECKSLQYNNYFQGKYDTILVVNGDGISDKVYEKLIKANRESKTILYLWDDRDTLYKTSHLKYFNNIYSYNIEDCLKYGYKYQSMFTQQKGLDTLRHDGIKTHDICIIGSATDKRVRIVKRILSKYNNDYSFYIYLYSKKKRTDIETFDVPLSFDKYLRVLEKSKCLLEIVRLHQTGPTTRINDCLFTKTKVITTNPHISKYPCYSKNIMIMNNHIEIPSNFIDEPYNETGMKGTDISTWVNNLLR